MFVAKMKINLFKCILWLKVKLMVIYQNRLRKHRTAAVVSNTGNLSP